MARHLRWDPRARRRSALQELVALTRFPADALARYPNELSGGQAPARGMMRALMLDPEVLLLDEPLGALDPLVRAELRDDLRGIFRSLAQDGRLVTHDVGRGGVPRATSRADARGARRAAGPVRRARRAPRRPVRHRVPRDRQRRSLARAPESGG